MIFVCETSGKAFEINLRLRWAIKGRNGGDMAQVDGIAWIMDNCIVCLKHSLSEVSQNLMTIV